MSKHRGTACIIFVTSPNREVSLKIVRTLVEKKLAPCVSIIPSAKSIYWWKGRIEESDEEVLVIKTRLDLIEDLIDAIRSIHPYEVPEIIALPIVMGYSKYLEWIDEYLK